MKWTTWLLFGLALGLCAALFAMVGRRSARSPAEFFASLSTQIEAGVLDDDAALSNLDLALRQAQQADDATLGDDVRLARGRILARIGSWERAKEDFELVREHRGSSPALEKLLTDVEARSGDVGAALERVRGRLEREPADLSTWRESALLHARSSRLNLEEARKIVRASLVPSDVPESERSCARLSTLDRSDPSRVAWAQRLRTAFGVERGTELERTLGFCDQASEDARGAFVALARVLRERADPECLATLWAFLVDAGEEHMIADVAAATLRMPDVRNDLACSTLVLDTLLDMKRSRFATQVAGPWLTRTSAAPATFFASACRAFYSTGAWAQLGQAAATMSTVADTAQVPWVDFYWGIARVRQPALGRDQTLYGRINLVTRFLNSTAIDPQPNARVIAWQVAAEASRLLGEPNAEREQIRGALDLDPEVDGELWLRLVELSRGNPNSSVRDQQENWARGMCLLPARHTELVAKWLELGELELRSAGTDPVVERSEQLARGVWTPPPGASLYELHALAKLHLQSNDVPRANQCAAEMLRRLPNFLPAIDLAIECARREERQRELVELAVRRVRAAGADDATRELMRTLPTNDLSANDLLELMRGDPAGFGRVRIARALRAQGEPRRALELLETLDASARTQATRELAASIALDLGEPSRALAQLEREGGGSSGDPTLFLTAALRSNDEKRLGEVVEQLASRGQPKKARWVSLADQLLAAGRPALAQKLLERLDEAPETRGGDVVLRLAQCALLQRQRATCDEFLTRAQAFDTEYGYELTRLAQAADNQAWDDVERWATALTESSLRAGPLQRALLAILGGNLERAQELVDAGVKKEPRSPTWRLAEAIRARLADERWEPPPYFGATILRETNLFLVGSESRGDARYCAALLLGSLMPSGQAWSRMRTEAFPRRARGSLWQLYLLGQQARGENNHERARTLLGKLVELHPGFGPGWDALERTPLAPSGSAFQPRASAFALGDGELERLKLRERRLAALGNLAGTPAERALDAARLALARQDLDAASKSSLEAVELAPTNAAAHHVLSRVLDARGELPGALAAQRKALELAGDQADAREVERHLGLLARAQAATPPQVTPEQVDTEVKQLSRAHPDDPRVVVAAARVDLRSDPENAPAGVARAVARLQAFRARHPDEPLDRIAPGSLAAWSELLGEIDPDRAATLLARERSLEPGNPDVWLFAARAAALQGDVDLALRDLATLQALVPNSQAARERLRWLAKRETRPEELAKAVEAALAAEKLDTPDAELALLRAEGQWTLGPRNAEAVIGLLAPLDPTALGGKPLGGDLDERRDWLLVLASVCRSQVQKEQSTDALTTATEALARLHARAQEPRRIACVAALEGVVATARTMRASE